MGSRWNPAKRRIERASSLEVSMKQRIETPLHGSAHTESPNLDQRLKSRRTYSLGQEEVCPSLRNSLKRSHRTASIHTQKRSRIESPFTIDKLQATLISAAEGQATTIETGDRSVTSETSLRECGNLFDGEKKKIRSPTSELQRGSHYLTEITPPKVTGTIFAAAPDFESTYFIDALHAAEQAAMRTTSLIESESPVDAVSPLDIFPSLEGIALMEAAETPTKTRLSEDTQPSQCYQNYVTSEHLEPSHDPGSFLNPFVISDEGTDSEDDVDTKGGGEAHGGIDARRSRRPHRLPGVVDWTLETYRNERKEFLLIEWENVQKQWAEFYTCEAFYHFKRLRAFEKQLERVWEHTEDHNDLPPGKARKLCSQWKVKEQKLLKRLGSELDRDIVREFGRKLVRLQEVEAERQSGEISMGDGDDNDDDYLPSLRMRLGG